jgi:hypothetical protein
MTLYDTSPQKWLVTIASLIVLPPWVWLAVRTKNCLQVITVRSIPFPKRTIWLIKILALIIGAGGVFGVTTELGMSGLFGCASPKLRAHMKSITYIDAVTCYMDEDRLARTFGEEHLCLAKN